MNPDTSFGDFCFSANARSLHHERAALIVATSGERVRPCSTSRLATRRESSAARSRVSCAPKIGFLFTDAGASDTALIQELHGTHCTACGTSDSILAALSSMLNPLLLANGLGADLGGSPPSRFALPHALVVLLKACGIEPNVVAGHGLDEFAAACAAGTINATRLRRPDSGERA